MFKGGGAKGIAYAGALQACEDAGITLRAVAGSSAGAITATMIACGYSARTSAEKMPEALAAIDSPARAMFRFGRSSLLDNAQLHWWLRRTIAESVRGQFEGEPADCTFSQLFDKTEIELFIVTMDLATGQPVVFSHSLTPDVSVAAAVVASSAIPVAFPPSRMTANDEIYRLVDGGAWANYPAFVFLDADFRAYHGLPQLNDANTIGFILDTVSADDAQGDVADTSVFARALRPMRGSRLPTDSGSAVRKFGTSGAVMTSSMLRWSAIIVPVLFVILAVAWLRAEVTTGFSVLGRLPEALEDLSLAILITVFAIAGTMAVLVALVTVRLGKDLLDIGTVGANAAMGVGPSVPYWVGTNHEGSDTRHIAIRIPVPPKLKTLQFRPEDSLMNEAISAGYQAASQRLSADLRRPITRSEPIAVDAAHMTRSVPRGVRTLWRRTAGPGDSLRRRCLLWPARAASRFGRWLYSVARGDTLVSWLVLFALILTWTAYAPYLVLRSLVEQGALVTILWLMCSAVGALGTAWLLARRSGSPKRSAPAFARVRSRRLLAFAALSLAGVTAFATMMFARDDASIISVLRTSKVAAVVDDVRQTNDGGVEIDLNISLSLAELTNSSGDEPSASVPPTSNTTRLGRCAINPQACEPFVLTAPRGFRETIDRLRRDASGRVIERCPDRLGRCLTFRTEETNLLRGDVHVVRFDAHRGLALLEQDLWSLERQGFVFAAVVLVFGPMALAVAFFRAFRWQRQRRYLDTQPR